jgi:hypothetical protein
MKAKGHDVRLRIFRNGNELKEFAEVVSLDVDFGVSTEVVDYVGAEDPHIFVNNGPATLRITCEPGSTALGELTWAQMNSNRPNAVREPVDIDVTVSLDFGDGGRDRWAFPACVLSAPTKSVSSRTARVQGAFELMCPRPQRI